MGMISLKPYRGPLSQRSRRDTQFLDGESTEAETHALVRLRQGKPLMLEDLLSNVADLHGGL